MRRKFKLSPSKLTTYLVCPIRYRWTYLDPRGKWFLRAKPYYSFGLTLHAVLQKFHDGGETGVQTTQEAIASMEENWVSAGYASPEEAAEAQAEGRELITAYVESHAAASPGAQTLFVERQLQCDMGEFCLTGRLDRVDELADGGLEIIDYKTGRWLTSEQELASDVAMNCYQLLLRSAMPDKRVLSTIISVKTGKRTTFEPTEQVLSEFRDDVIFLGNEMLHRDFETAEPKVKSICPKCDFLPLCLRHDEFREDFEQLHGPSEE